MKTYENVIDKSRWPRGPWDTEPDKVVWIDEATDLDCMIVRNSLGALCGYAAVAPGHPFYGKDYDDVDVSVHGGLTYGARCQEGQPEAEGVCHVPQPGRPADVFWFGFDTAHFMDRVPGMPAIPGLEDFDGDTTYKTFDYVKAEVEDLAKQLAAVSS